MQQQQITPEEREILSYKLKSTRKTLRPETLDRFLLIGFGLGELRDYSLLTILRNTLGTNWIPYFFQLVSKVNGTNPQPPLIVTKNTRIPYSVLAREVHLALGLFAQFGIQNGLDPNRINLTEALPYYENRGFEKFLEKFRMSYDLHYKRGTAHFFVQETLREIHNEIGMDLEEEGMDLEDSEYEEPDPGIIEQSEEVEEGVLPPIEGPAMTYEKVPKNPIDLDEVVPESDLEEEEYTNGKSEHEVTMGESLIRLAKKQKKTNKKKGKKKESTNMLKQEMEKEKKEEVKKIAKKEEEKSTKLDEPSKVEVEQKPQRKEVTADFEMTPEKKWNYFQYYTNKLDEIYKTGKFILHNNEPIRMHDPKALWNKGYDIKSELQRFIQHTPSVNTKPGNISIKDIYTHALYIDGDWWYQTSPSTGELNMYQFLNDLGKDSVRAQILKELQMHYPFFTIDMLKKPEIQERDSRFWWIKTGPFEYFVDKQSPYSILKKVPGIPPYQGHILYYDITDSERIKKYYEQMNRSSTGTK